MRKNRKFGFYIFPVLYLFLFPSQFNGFAQVLRFKHLGLEEGLSQTSVNCIAQDKHGFLWIGTQDGLNKYDGYNFTVFRSDPADAGSISHNWIWDVFSDHSGNLWIATWRGLTKYDLHTGKFTRFLPDSSDPGSISGERPSAICEDKDGNLWIATWGNGLNRYDPISGKFTHFLFNPDKHNSVPGDFIREVYCDSRNRLWIGTWSGLALATKGEDGQFTFRQFRHNDQDTASLGGNRIMRVLEDHAGRIWIATRGGGLNLFHEQDSTFVHFKYDPDNPRSISSDDVCTIFEDSQERFWVGTFTEGLNLFDVEKGDFTRIYHDPDNREGIGSNSVYSIMEDQSGLLWIGAGGLNILNVEGNRFGLYRHQEKNEHSLSYNDVSSFYEDAFGKIWIGTEGGGLNRFDRKTGYCKIYRSDPEDPSSVAGNNISEIAGNGSGVIWVASRGGGLDRFDIATERFTHIKTLKGLSEQEQEGLKYINDMCFLSEDILWIATDNVGLIRYDPANEEAVSFNSTSRSGGNFPGNSLLTVSPDTRGTLWIGTWGIGLYSLDRKTFRFTGYPVSDKDTLALAGNIVHVIRETIDSSGRRIWVGTNKGLCYKDPDQIGNTGFSRLGIENGLPSNIVYGILQDNRKNIWMSTNRGLSRFNPYTREIRNFDIHDGLQSNEFNGHSCLKLKDGTLLFGGVNGFNLFYPEQIRESTYQPPVVLTGFSVFNRTMEFENTLQEIRKIRLSYKQNFFSFEFAALDFAQPARLKYAYWMEGVENGWIFSGSRRYANYTNINPGKYVFHIKGTNRDGVWSNHELAIEIMIRPPYWKTWWFRFLGLMLILGILYGLHRLNIEKVLAVERLRLRIASDLHDDIGSALTRISITSEQLQTTQDHSRMVSLAKTIGHISRDIISTISDIIWSIDVRNDTLNQLTDHMQDVVYTAFSMKDVKVAFQQHGLKKKKKIPVDIRQNLFYIFKEVINNIVKHSDATKVDILLSNTEKGFTMKIGDNGKGFDPQKVKMGNGLRNIRMRAERLKADLVIDTDHGVQVILKMKRL